MESALEVCALVVVSLTAHAASDNYLGVMNDVQEDSLSIRNFQSFSSTATSSLSTVPKCLTLLIGVIIM